MREIQEIDLTEAFNVFDADADGYVTAAELYDAFTKLGEATTREEAFEILKEADTNSDGLLDFEGNVQESQIQI